MKKADLPIGTRVEKNGVTGTTVSLRSKANFYAVEVDESGLMEIWDGVWMNPILEYFVLVNPTLGIVRDKLYLTHTSAKEAVPAGYYICKITLEPLP